MTAARIHVDDARLQIRVGDLQIELPIGVTTLMRDELQHDPPRAEQLTNAIAVVVDHLDDAVRAAPQLAGCELGLTGPTMTAIAAVEIGAALDPPFLLSRAAAEDVFRTVATESTRERASNPGLVEAMVGPIVAGCCILVAVMRRLQLDEVTILDMAGLDMDGLDMDGLDMDGTA